MLLVFTLCTLNGCIWNEMLLLIYFIVLVCYIQIKINFLMVGHTREIIDQVFSRLGVQIKNQNILTLEGMFIHHACCCCGMLQTVTPSPPPPFWALCKKSFDFKYEAQDCVFEAIRAKWQGSYSNTTLETHRVHHLVHLPLKCWYITTSIYGHV